MQFKRATFDKIVLSRNILYWIIIWGIVSSIHASSWRTGYAYSERCSKYYQNYNETPERVLWIHNNAVNKGIIALCDSIGPIGNPLDYIKKTHTIQYVDLISTIPVDSTGGATEKIGDIAILAAGYALGAVRDVCEGKVRNAFCNLRPPGHHVVNDGPTGYCVFANVVIAARYAREVYGKERVLIVDWDCHHGNGTVSFLCKDTNVLFLETGSGDIDYPSCDSLKPHIFSKGVANNKNNADFVKVWQDVFLPQADAFKPDIVLISCGFDLKMGDPVCGGTLNATALGISQFTRMAMDIADKHCDGKLVSFLEGGYRDPAGNNTYQGLAECAENHLKTLITGQIQSETPFFITGIIANNRIPFTTHSSGNLLALLSQSSAKQVRVFNVRGSMLFEQKPVNEFPRLSAGIYFIEYMNDKNVKVLFPYIKQ